MNLHVHQQIGVDVLKNLLETTGPRGAEFLTAHRQRD